MRPRFLFPVFAAALSLVAAPRAAHAQRIYSRDYEPRIERTRFDLEERAERRREEARERAERTRERARERAAEARERKERLAADREFARARAARLRERIHIDRVRVQPLRIRW
jgi:hypothetical protein